MNTAHESVFDVYVRSNAREQLEKPAFFEFNVYGLAYYKTNIDAYNNMQSSDYLIHADIAYALLYSFIQTIEYFYRKAGYAGLVDLSMELRCEGGSAILWRENEDWIGTEPIRDKFFSVERRLLTTRLQDDEVVIDVYNRFLWGAGSGTSLLASQAVERQLTSLREEFGSIPLAIEGELYKANIFS